MQKFYGLILLTLLSLALSAQVTLPVDFESPTLTYVLTPFEGADSAIETNPDQSGENTSATVVRTIKTQDAQFFAGTTLELDAPIDFSTNKGISIQTWSPKAGIPVRLKIEGATADIFAELDVNTTVANGWETLTFDFTNLANTNLSYTKVIVFFEFVVDLPGDGSTYYYDNIQTVAVDGVDGVGLPVDFESTTLTYTLTGFEGADSAVETNPDQSGQNTSATVVRTTKTMGAQFFAGTTLDLDIPINFATDKGISIQTWSPKAGIPVRLKVETANANVFAELDVNTTVANQWETLTFDFTDLLTPNANYIKVIVFFEFVVDRAGDGAVYYYDNIQTVDVAGGGAGDVGLPVDFESTELNYVITGFEGADSAIEANPDQSGENTSATIVRTTKTDGAQFFAGTTLNLDTPIDFSTNKGISIQTWSPKAGIPVRLKLETANPDIFAEIDVNTTVANQWETLTYDFTGLVDVSRRYIRVIVFFEFVVDLPGDGSTYYYDNIQTVEIGGGGGDVVALPLTFEEMITYEFTGFEGADSAIETNPDQSGQNTSATIMRTTKTMGSQFFAGTVVELTEAIDFSNSGKVFVQTWSPKAGIPVRLKLEGATNDIFVELDATTTVANAWETLEYDFAAVLDPNASYVKVIVFFEFVVDLPGDGTTYYFDNVAVGSPVSVTQLTAEQVNIFPNPATDRWSIASPEAMIDVIDLFDVNGRQLLHATPRTFTYDVPAAQLPAGTYFLRVNTAEGFRVVRLIKQ